MAFGESINQFYSAITKDLSFYEYIPLLIAVTLVLVVLIIFGTSFLSLLLFNYELNFFHLIKISKSQQNVQPHINEADKKKIKLTEPKNTDIRRSERIKNGSLKFTPWVKFKYYKYYVVKIAY